MPPTVLEDPRRAAVLASSDVNGLDYVEVEDDRRTLRLKFLKPVPTRSLLPANLLVSGGERPSRIPVLDVRGAGRPDDDVVRVTLQRTGDRSTYTLRLIDERDARRPPDGYDVVLSQATFRFITARADPYAAVDCALPPPAEPVEAPLPEIDYLAKDYASFRRSMLERLSLLIPGWTETNPADEGVMLVELLAYVGDYLSYEQDAIATEAYLGTARLRTSLRRHARLVDYTVDDGANARAIVHVDVDPEAPSFRLPPRTAFLTAAPGVALRLPAGAAVESIARVAGSHVFESLQAATLRGSLAAPLQVYTWGERDYALETGATSATLLGRIEGLHPGDLLLLHERRADAADFYHPVRLTAIDHGDDPLGGVFAAKPRRAPAALTTVAWHDEDALPQRLLVAQSTRDGEDVTDRSGLTTVLANNVLVDHGFTVVESLGAASEPPFRPVLAQGPLVFARPFVASAAVRMLQPAGAAGAAISLSSTSEAGALAWTVRADLLESDAQATDFVAEVEDDAAATLRFGDGEFGRVPVPGASFTATYRIGGGAAGNVGEGTIASIVSGDDRILAVSNPLPARGGSAPETLAHIREHAPGAYREPLRAVTASDYATLASAHPGVLSAVATIRRDGVRQSVIVTVDRRGGLAVDARFRTALQRELEPFRLIGVDLEIRGARLVPLHVVVAAGARAGYRLRDVRSAVEQALGSCFSPDRLAMGAPVYAGAIVAAAMAVEGVAYATVAELQRLDRAGPPLPADGVLHLAPYDKAQVANDPRYPDRGVLRVRVRGAA